MDTKVCKKCGVEKELGEFYKQSKREGHYFSKCRACMQQAQKEKRKTNYELIRSYEKKSSSREGVAEAKKEYRKKLAKREHEEKKPKICTDCFILKNPEDFVVSSTCKDGLSYKCRSCLSDYKKEYRNLNSEKLKELDKRRSNLPHRELARAEYAKTDRGKQASKRAAKTWKTNNLLKFRAQDKLRKAVKSGKVQKLPCEVCGSERSQGHHEDYTKPLDVVWYCHRHHIDRHKEMRALGIAFDEFGKQVQLVKVRSVGQMDRQIVFPTEDRP